MARISTGIAAFVSVTKRVKTTTILLALVVSVLLPSVLRATTTINVANRYAYGANLGWMDGRGDTNNGAVIGEYVCSGYIYSANIGWINLGNGSPTNGIYYQNLSTNDFGVNQDGLGNLRGYAWSGNVGWINFETNGAPKIDLVTGKFSGSVYSANCGWISLSNATAYVQADSVQQGALAPDGLPVAWLMTYFGTTNVSASADPDGDGLNNQQEYLAGTNPNNASSTLKITTATHGLSTPTYTILGWTAVPTRFYAIQYRTNLLTGSWADYAVLPGLGTSSVGFDDYYNTDFFRIRAFRYLTP